MNNHGCQRLDCVYRLLTTGQCDYFEVEGHTRTALHQNEPGVDINNPCREYKPGNKHSHYVMRVKY